VRCNSYAISLFSLALQTSFTTCFSRKLSIRLRGFLIFLGVAQFGQIRLPFSPRNSFPHRKQLRRCLNSIKVFTVKNSRINYSRNKSPNQNANNLALPCQQRHFIGGAPTLPYPHISAQVYIPLVQTTTSYSYKLPADARTPNTICPPTRIVSRTEGPSIAEF
jgi:hypothetical protein